MPKWPQVLEQLGLERDAPRRAPTERLEGGAESETTPDFLADSSTESLDEVEPASVTRLRGQALLGQKIRGYRLERVLGSGAFSEVFAATHEHLDRRVAVKVLMVEPDTSAHRAMVPRMLREARAMARLHHPNVTEVLDCGTTRTGLAFVIQELVDGVSLKDILEREAPLTLPRATHLLIQLCRGLAATHSAGLVHRDLKPGNIVVTQSEGVEHLKLLDFGLVVAEEDTRLTRAGDFLGTPAFVAPEQILAPSEAVPASDMYAVGMITYIMLTGLPPYSSPIVDEMLKLHLEAPVKRIDEHGLLGELAVQLLAKHPAARPTGADVLAQLEGHLSVAETPSHSDPRFDRARPSSAAGEPTLTPRSADASLSTWALYATVGTLTAAILAGALLLARLPGRATETRTPAPEVLAPDPVISAVGEPLEPLAMEPEPTAEDPATPPEPALRPVRRRPTPPSLDPQTVRAFEAQLRSALSERGLQESDLPALEMPQAAAWRRARRGQDAAELEEAHKALLAALARYEPTERELEARLSACLSSLRALALPVDEANRLERQYLELRSKLSDTQRRGAVSGKALVSFLQPLRTLEREIAAARSGT